MGLTSVEKTLHILMSFTTKQHTWGVRQLGEYLEINPATVHRTLKTLQAYNFIDQDPVTRKYHLGNIYFSFIHTLQENFSIFKEIRPYMQTLLSSVRETVHINIIESKMRVCIDTIDSPERLKASMPIGSRAPLYSGATSKCLLAFSTPDFIENYLQDVNLTRLTNHTITDITQLRVELTKIKNKCYAASLGELSSGLGALSAPLFNSQNVLLASLSLAMPEQRYRDRSHKKFCIRQLCDTANKFSRIKEKKVKINV